MSFHLRPHLDRARRLIEAGDQPSLAYAALELRLGIKLVCFEKLRMRLKQVSGEGIKDWCPNKILEELDDLVDPNLSKDMIVAVAGEPVSEAPKTWSRICEQKGVDPRLLRSIWNKLGSYLHVEKPKDQHSSVRAYPDARRLDLIDQLEPLASGSDINFAPDLLYFYCSCGFKISRVTPTLRQGQVVFCPECKKEWVVQEQGDGRYGFRTNVVEFDCCRCGHKTPIAHKDLRELRPDHRGRLTCDDCGARHLLRCQFDYRLEE